MGKLTKDILSVVYLFNPNESYSVEELLITFDREKAETHHKALLPKKEGDIDIEDFEFPIDEPLSDAQKDQIIEAFQTVMEWGT